MESAEERGARTKAVVFLRRVPARSEHERTPELDVVGATATVG